VPPPSPSPRSWPLVTPPPPPVTLCGGRRVARWLAAFPAARCRLRVVDFFYERATVSDATLAALGAAAGAVVVELLGCPNVTDAGLAALARSEAPPLRLRVAGDDNGALALTLTRLPRVTDAGGAALLAAPAAAWRAVVFHECPRVTGAVLASLAGAADGDDAVAAAGGGGSGGGRRQCVLGVGIHACGAVTPEHLAAVAAAATSAAAPGGGLARLQRLSLRGWPPLLAAVDACAAAPHLGSLELVWDEHALPWSSSGRRAATPLPPALPPTFSVHLRSLRRLVLGVDNLDFFHGQRLVVPADSGSGGGPFAGLVSLREATLQGLALDDAALAPLARSLTHLKLDCVAVFTGAGLAQLALLQRLTLVRCPDLVEPVRTVAALPCAERCPRLVDVTLRTTFNSEDVVQFKAVGPVACDFWAADHGMPDSWWSDSEHYKNGGGCGRYLVLRAWDTRVCRTAPVSFGGSVVGVHDHPRGVYTWREGLY
jgi:hypothetical protein